MQIRRLFRFLTPLLLIMLTVVLAGCDAYGPKPTPAPKPTIVPAATIGSLQPVSIDKFGVSLVTPSTWKAPTVIEEGFVLSPDGSSDTSGNGPFLYVMPDAAQSISKRMTFSFKPDITDPVQQLDALVQALNVDAYQFTKAKVYEGAKYPAASVTGFTKDNQTNITLLNAGNNRWVYVGTQAPERYFSYYDSAVFQPAINSLSVK